MLNMRLLVFSKVPEEGRVKTRMQPDYSPAFSVRLHRALVRYCMHQYLQSHMTTVLNVAGDLSSWKQQFPVYAAVPLFAQVGNDLGERLHTAALRHLQQADAVILLGTDCPAVDAAYLMAAQQALLNYDCVIGPANDGGYVLLGIKSAPSSLFQCIDWGTEHVLEQTIKALEALSWSYHCLASLPDIDYPKDLQHLKSLPFFDELFTP